MELLSLSLINWAREGQEPKAAKLTSEMAAEIHCYEHRLEARRLKHGKV